jgi:tRNA (guanine-N7-)-methyltransferase
MGNHSLPQQRYVWGRRQTRPLKEKQRQALETLWPQVCLELPSNSMIQLEGLFNAPLEHFWLEIGFGSGEHLATQASHNSHVGFIGCEPFINGVASLVSSIYEKPLKNIRIVKDDARLLLARLPNQSIGRIYVLFPDPWPKKRHHKRRIIQNEAVRMCLRILQPGGLLVMATDDEEYAHWIQNTMAEQPAFEQVLEGRASIFERPNDWSTTRYEKKGIAAGRVPVYLVYKSMT